MGIIFLIVGVGILLVGISFIFAWREDCWDGLDFDNWGSITFNIFAGFVFVCALIAGICAICINGYKESKIYNMGETRKYLVETYNLYKSEYDDDIMHYETMKDISREIANFNIMLHEEDLYNDSVWIGCFYIGSCGIEKIVIENGVAK